MSEPAPSAPDPVSPKPDEERFDPHDDPMAPPEVACECFCLHCRRTFMSDGMWFQRVINARDGFKGFWMCPTANCSGAGFAFDIFPTDPDHPANDGWSWSDDDEEEFEDDEALDDELDLEESSTLPETNYDPSEPKYAALDEELADEEDDDTEGEEWKYGVAPADVFATPDSYAQSEEDEEEAMYDQPDQRPRVLDWSDREERETLSDDDIPF